MAKVVKLGFHPEKFYRPLQFDFFQSQDPRVTNTIAIWDVAPRCVFRKHERDKITENYFKPVEREFVYGDQLYRLTLTPARIRKDGKRSAGDPGGAAQPAGAGD